MDKTDYKQEIYLGSGFFFNISFQNLLQINEKMEIIKNNPTN